MGSYIVFAGYSDKPTDKYAKPWRNYPATEEGIAEAVKNGYTAISTMSFEYPPEKGKEESNRRGDLYLDFDDKENPFASIQRFRKFVRLLETRYAINPNLCSYWLSGGKGCHLAIPAELFEGETGDRYLPYIHKNMVKFIISGNQLPVDQWFKNVDLSMYCMGQGKLLRLENIQRSNGHYKVPVTPYEFFNLSEQDLFDLTLVSSCIIKTNNYILLFSKEYLWLDRQEKWI